MRSINENLEHIVLALLAKQPSQKAEFDDIRRQKCSELRIAQPSNRLLYKSYQKLVKKKRVERNQAVEIFFRKATMRSASGIAIITSLVKPYMCPGKCVYCPTEARMPKSYIASEPAAARALRLEFSPYEQMRRRIQMLEENAHPTDKIEYIIKGGTWNAYPLKYQYWFILESFRACNEFSKKKLRNIRQRTDQPLAEETGKQTLDEQSSVEALQQALEKEQRRNEVAKHRIIGLTLETRPDAIAPKTILHMRKQGCTRVELGLQAPDDEILTLIKRGHTVDQFRKAILLLRTAGFKVDLHFMPDLPGTTPEHDVQMYRSLFTDPALRPDMVKIYPNTVIKSAELYEWFKDGRYKPYGDKALFDALMQMKLLTPRYCRISRLIRDIPADEIQAGNKVTNLREALEKEILRQGKRCVCLRCREISRQAHRLDKDTVPQLFVDEYETLGGKEFFLTFEDPKRIAVFGFLRLRIPVKIADSTNSADTVQKINLANSTNVDNLENVQHLLPEIKNCAFVRELHVYGQLVKIGEKQQQASQHKGLGGSLLSIAEKIAKEHKYSRMAVISGVGVRGYYRKHGYRKKGTYMIKSF